MRAEPRLVSLFVSIETSEVWPAAAIRSGAQTRISVAAEPGPCGVLAAAAFGSLPTPFGELRLDPGSPVRMKGGNVAAATCIPLRWD